MSDPDDQKPNYTTYRVVVIGVMVLFAAALIFGPIIVRWYQCQQLAPIERMFIRGC